jgi:phosphate transport system substrate-binding protein
LYLTINKTKTTKQARDFVDFVLSDEGQKIISEQGTVNLAEGKGLVDKWKARGYEL